MRLQLSCTLFPYTTLFRSARLARELGHRVAERHQRDVVATPAGARRDRKSTRLNSSHSSISYAGFCLKKKNLRHANDPFFSTMNLLTSASCSLLSSI